MVAMLCGVAAMAQSGTLSCADVTATAGGETAYLEIHFDSEDVVAVGGVQFDLVLPEGVTFATYYDEDEEDYLDDITFPIAKAKHICDYRPTARGGYQFGVAGDKTVDFRTTTNVLAKIGLNVPENATNGVYDVIIRNIVLGKKDGSGSVPVEGEVLPQLTITGGTGINGINAADSNAPIYNVAGQRVSKAQKGVFIQNGKKVAVK